MHKVGPMRCFARPAECSRSFPSRLRAFSAAAFFLVLATTGTAAATLTLDVEVNPDPVEPGQSIDVQMMITNTAGSTSGSLTLRVLWPDELNSTPVTTDGGSCPGSCDSGESLSWNLGPLGPGVTRVIGFSEFVGSGVASGTFFDLETDLLEAGSLVAEVDHTLEVEADSPLEIFVDPTRDPAPSGGLLVYEITYGNTSASAAEGSELRFPIPTGTQFVSATGGGLLIGGEVLWDLGSIGPRLASTERVTVQVDPVANGTHLVVDSATFDATLSFQPKTSRALAVSRVGDADLELAMEVGPGPVQPGQSMDVQISITNPTNAVSGNLTVRALWPEELNSTPVATNGGDCPGSCDTGEYLFWNLGVLGPGASIAIAFSEFVSSGVGSGRIVPLEVDLLEAGIPVRTWSRSTLVQSDSPLEVFLDPLQDPSPRPGELVYELTYANSSTSTAEDSELRFPIPEGTTFVAATGGGILENDEVSWSLGSVGANTGGIRRVTVEVLPGAESHLVADSATFSGTLNFQPRQSRAMAISRTGTSDLEFGMEVAPDPVQPGQSMDVQLLVTNPTNAVSGNLTIRALWPEELNSTPVATNGGDCPGSCDTGEYLFWNLGVLGPGASLAIGFSELVSTGVASGRAVPLEIELLEANLPSRTLSRTTLVLADSPLEVFVDPRADPAAGPTLVYEVTFGNSSNASADGAELRFPIPEGTQFFGATGGGTRIGDTVVWNLGAVPPHSAGREFVTVGIPASGASESHLFVDSASFSATLDFQPRSSRATAISRLGSADLDFSVSLGPDPIEPSEVLDAELTINNPSGTTTGNLSLRVLWPEELLSTPVVIGGGDCPGSCDTGEYLFWSLGPLGPGGQIDVGFSENVFSSVAEGRMVPVEIELLEAGLPVRTVSKSLVVSPFVDTDDDGIADVLDPDDDNDGMPDWWENANGLNPLNPADANGDPDGDGLTNLEEFLLGRDPNVFDLFFDGFESGNTSAWTSTVG